MIEKIRVPKLSANVEQVTVIGWLKSEGEHVRKGEPLVELTTDKAAFEYESPAGGILRRVIASPKSVLPIGYIIALVGGRDAPLPDVAEENDRVIRSITAAGGAADAPLRSRPAPQRAPAALAGGGGRQRVRATPAARRAAREQNVELAEVRDFSGKEPVTEEMIRQYLEGRE